MKTFRHVLNTWLLANLLHPFLFAFYLMIKGDEFAAASIPVLFIAGPVLAIPSLLLSLTFLNWLYKTHQHTLIKQTIWMVLVPIALLCNYILVLFLFDLEASFFRDIEFLMPALASAWIAILLRTYQLQDLFIDKIAEHENSMV